MKRRCRIQPLGELLTESEEAKIMTAFAKADQQRAETALGSKIQYGPLPPPQIECTLQQECPCGACRKVYSANKPHVGNGYD